MSEPCPCCSGKQYSLCCAPFLAGEQLPESAEQLMRSRYTAYAMQNSNWLIASWHPSQRVPDMAQRLSESFAGTEWLSLNVTCCNHGSHDNEAFVTFFARYRENSQIRAIHERSRFLREDHRWYYVDGTAPQTGRNDRCPCGSDKKYKKCCG
ncbi:YchJ family protein [Pantoea sp. ACRSB]|uniref:YchJ family protein n=1 Tax=Pantoea sp. ACRSB TaxID=2918207 RepID=UPI002892F7AB|nr:YchJ family protein [Pantoea sp. ACRSB]MCG7390881.1 YchJ family protein [Pantoea sp. ACRSB]